MESLLAHKWEGKASAKVTKASADQIWPLLMDFFNLHKWCPGLTNCYGIHGENGKLGCVRYGSALAFSSEGDKDIIENQKVNWAKERLISIDPIERSLSYEMMDNNFGFNSYLSTMKVIPSDVEGECGCTIEWSFSVDPVEGWTREDLVRVVYEAGVQGMAKKMEESFGN